MMLELFGVVCEHTYCRDFFKRGLEDNENLSSCAAASVAVSTNLIEQRRQSLPCLPRNQPG